MLEYLSRYAGDVTILTPELVEQEELDRWPEQWRSILGAAPKERIDQTLAMWKPFSQELQSLLAYLTKHLERVEVVRSSRGISLIYGIRAGDGSLMYYEGKLPTGEVPDDKQPLWEALPRALRAFYEKLHNGWYYFASESMGLVPRNDVIVLGDLEWGILESLDTVPVGLDQSLGLFHNGSGDYVCIEKREAGPRGFLWFHDSAPRTDIEFWPVVDSWLCIGLEG